mgnify:CR=1 FL=1
MRLVASLARLFARVFLRRRLPRIGAVLCLLVPLLLASRQVSGDGQAMGTLPMAEALLTMSVLLTGFGALLGSVAIAEDYQRGSLRSLITRPVRGSQIFLAYALVLTTFVLVLASLGTWLCSLVAGAGGFGPVSVDGYEVLSAAELSKVAQSVRFLPMMAIAASPVLGLAISALTRDSASAVALSMLILAAPSVMAIAGEATGIADPLAVARAPAELLLQYAKGVTIDGAKLESGAFRNWTLQAGALWLAGSAIIGSLLLEYREHRS